MTGYVERFTLRARDGRLTGRKTQAFCAWLEAWQERQRDGEPVTLLVARDHSHALAVGMDRARAGVS